jgi:hypothetical protein
MVSIRLVRTEVHEDSGRHFENHVGQAAARHHASTYRITQDASGDHPADSGPATTHSAPLRVSAFVQNIVFLFAESRRQPTYLRCAFRLILYDSSANTSQCPLNRAQAAQRELSSTAVVFRYGPRTSDAVDLANTMIYFDHDYTTRWFWTFPRNLRIRAFGCSDDVRGV